MKVFAHRGFSARFPENTEIAFVEAGRLACFGWECDVQLTKDGVPVIIHDETIDRTGDGQGFVQDHTLEDLKGFNFAKRFPGLEAQAILTLRDLLKLAGDMPKPFTLNIELKNSIIDYPGLEDAVLKEVAATAPDLDILYSSFNHDSMLRLVELNPKAITALLLDQLPDDLIGYLNQFRARGLHPSLPVAGAILDQLPLADFFCHVYTVNDADLAQALDKAGIDGIFTDNPKMILEEQTTWKQHLSF